MNRRPAPPGRGRRPGGPRRGVSPREGHEPRAPRPVWVRRPFEGMPSEADLVALREIVPSATAPLPLVGEHAGREVTLGTVLPLAWSAMVRRDGSVVLALQTPQRSGDAALDLGQALLSALAALPGSGVSGLPVPQADTPRLTDLVAAEPLAVTVREGFDWWIGDDQREDGLSAEVQASLEQANASVVPTERLGSVDAAYWCQIGARRHLRWALTEDEERLLDAFARLHVVGALGLGPGSKYVGAFRALGLLVPVWDLADDATAAGTEPEAAAFGQRLGEALADPSPLSPEQRRARAGVVSRQVTLR